MNTKNSTPTSPSCAPPPTPHLPSPKPTKNLRACSCEHEGFDRERVSLVRKSRHWMAGRGDLLDLFSIGVCYEDRKEEFLPYLQSIVDNAQPYIDPTLELYIKYLGLKPNEGKHAKFKVNYLERLLNSEDKVKALKNTMANWYRFNQGQPWYGRHERENYDGYWAFDVCGLVKILGIDDDVVKDHKYYPYDLVHFNDKKK